MTTRRKRRSAEQREASADFAWVVKTWESLTEQQRVTWRIEGESRGMSGYNYFIKVNMRRRRDGQAPAALPPLDAPYLENPVRKLVITNRARRIKLELEVSETPAGRILVFASPPCNRGVARYNKWYIRLGWLPAPHAGRSDITRMYVAKFGWPPPGKRVFIRTLVRLEGRPEFPKETSAVVPPPEGRGRGPEKA
jgi:hypothetical protein